MLRFGGFDRFNILFYKFRLSGTSAEDGHTLSHRKMEKRKAGVSEGRNKIFYLGMWLISVI